MRINFNPRSPRGERRAPLTGPNGLRRFQPSLPARGATLSTLQNDVVFQNFNPRSPRGERHNLMDKGEQVLTFQPSLPARGATSWNPSECRCRTHFNPRSPRGERRLPSIPAHFAVQISTLAPREGSDGLCQIFPFLAVISTLAPREGSDSRPAGPPPGPGHFNPRSPRGERRVRRQYDLWTGQDFNPRSPRGERRPELRRRPHLLQISTLAPREGSDSPSSSAASSSS